MTDADPNGRTNLELIALSMSKGEYQDALARCEAELAHAQPVSAWEKHQLQTLKATCLEALGDQGGAQEMLSKAAKLAGAECKYWARAAASSYAELARIQFMSSDGEVAARNAREALRFLGISPEPSSIVESVLRDLRAWRERSS